MTELLLNQCLELVGTGRVGGRVIDGKLSPMLNLGLELHSFDSTDLIQ